MEFLLYLLQRTWSWIANNGLSIAALLILVVLIPRIRRFVIAVATGNMSEGEEATKGRRALIGAVVYIVEMIAYFIVGIALLGQFGVSLTAAAVPATVVSAAIGFGAQGVIADLLGGVFIIAEKQYGIGDWVEFHSPSGTVQGDVVNMTLRATTIRTLNGEEVVVPNSEARMCVNYSSKWSRAVIEMPVPMTAGGSIRDLEERTLEAARRAIAADGVKEHVLSEIRIQSSTQLVAPTTMGLPWTVTMRLIVDCEPGDQWLIERAVRSEIIDTWWDDYGERATGNPLKTAEALSAHFGALPAGVADRFGQSPATRPDSLDDADGPTTMLGAGRGAGPASRRGEGSLEVEQAHAAAQDAAASGDERRRSDIPSAGARMDAERRKAGNDPDDSGETAVMPRGRYGAADRDEDDPDVHDGKDGDDAAEKQSSAEAATGPEWSAMTRRERVRRVLSAGGRARPSTVVMISALVVLGLLNLATVEPGEGEDGVAGWLAPSRFTGESETTEENTGGETGTGNGGSTTAPPTTTRQQDEIRPPQNESGTGTGTGTGTGGTGDTGGTGTGTGTGGTGTGTDTGTGTGDTGGTGTGTDAGTGTGGGTDGTGTGTGTGTGGTAN